MLHGEEWAEKVSPRFCWPQVHTRRKGNGMRQKQEIRGCRAPWLMPVIPATREAEIRRIRVPSQHRQIVFKTPSQKNLSQKIVLVEWLKLTQR
jgi:hypothetical protein